MKATNTSKYGVKLFNGTYQELTLFIGKLQLRFSMPQTAAWWNMKRLYSFGKGHKHELPL